MQHTTHHNEHGMKNAHSTHWQLQEVEMLVHDLWQLLARDPNIFSDTNIERELQVLERWGDHYHRELVPADAFLETSIILITTLHDRLKLALETVPQGDRSEALVNAICRIERILNRDSHISY